MKSILIEKNEHYELKNLSARLDRSMKNLLSEALEDLLKKYKEENKNESGRDTTS